MTNKPLAAAGTWHEAVKDACTVACIGWTDDPKTTIDRLISWHVEIALDPSVSERAAALQCLHPLAASAVPDGWQLVPIEPTQEMNTAGYMRNLELGGAKRSADETYRAMLAAAPRQEAQPAVQDLLRDMLAIQEACGLHTDEYAPGSVIEYIKELKDDAAPSQQPAAAPDLLAALQEIVSTNHYDFRGNENARAAIARATGEQP